MRSRFKDFINDIKYAFNDLPEYLGIVFFLCLLFGIFLGIDIAIGAFIILLSFWFILFILFPFFLFVLDLIKKT